MKHFILMIFFSMIHTNSFAFNSYQKYEGLIDSCVKQHSKKSCQKAYNWAKEKSASLDQKYNQIMMNKPTSSLSLESSIEMRKNHNKEVKKFNRLTLKLQAIPNYKFNRYILEAERSLSFQSEYADSNESSQAQLWNQNLKQSYKERATLQAVGWLDKVRYR